MYVVPAKGLRGGVSTEGKIAGRDRESTGDDAADEDEDFNTDFGLNVDRMAVGADDPEVVVLCSDAGLLERVTSRGGASSLDEDVCDVRRIGLEGVSTASED